MKSLTRVTLAAAWACALPLACDGNMDGSSETPGAATIEREDQALTQSAQATIAQSLLDAFKQSLKVDLLDPYYPTAHDGSYGGFVEDRSGTWVPQQDSDKFVSLQARLTWTAAKASQFYASNPTQAAQYLASAAVGYQFLTRMWLGSASGFAMMVDRNGSNGRNTGKETYITYGNAFGMYAAAAYYAASGDANALTLAINAYNYLNSNLYDSQYGGYYITASDKRKETNTNVHVLEALIELYKDLPTSHALRTEVASRISQLLGRFHDSAIHCPAGNDCFAYPVMNQDWTANTSDVSFGHDLELSMLMVEAISALGQDPVTSPYIAKIKKVVDFTFAHGGYRSDGGFYYTGTYSGGNVSINDSQVQWWPQAEGLGALCLMRTLFPSDTTYEPTINKSWNFIKTQVIDATNHGWVRQAGDWNIAKGWEWHCNYHNGRALMNCLTWLTATPPPAPTCSDGIQNQGETGVDCGGPCAACTVSNAIWIEAETGVLSGSPAFATNSDSAASGGKYIQPTTNSPSAAGPNRATFTFTSAAGTYKVWGRVISPTADDDSFWVSMDGGAFVMWNGIPASSAWAWDDVHDSNNGGAAVTYTLAQGSHTLVIANREDGVKLDKVYITAKGDTPSGLGGGNTCVPTTCSAAGATCGSLSDGCGGTLACGTCGTGQTCTANKCVQNSGTGPFLESGGMVVMEAEHYTTRRQDLTTADQWNAVAVASASGGTVMQVGPDSTTQIHTTQADVQTNAARMDYPVNFTTTGTWNFWIRGASTTSAGYASDSVHGGIDNTASALNFDFVEDGSYTWLKKTITVPSAGTHTIQVYMREDGFYADKIVLTTSASYTPTNLGPAESARQ